MLRSLSFILLALTFLLASPAHAADADAEANKLFVEAVQLTRRADTTYDTKESVRLLRGANQLLKKIVANYPQSEIAVQLSTHQLIGDFDITEFEGRIRSLSCARGSYVEDFLSEYGIASGTGPLTEACFLYRMENLLIQPEPPISTVRGDWLALAVGYNVSGQEERARSIVLPYMGVLRKNGSGAVPADAYFVLARALALTGADMQAQQVADHISECSSRLSYMMTTLQAALAHDDDDAKTIAEQIRREAEANSCEWQQGLVVRALMFINREADARALYEKALARRGEDAASGTPPELVMASAMLDEPATVLAMTRTVMEHDPYVVPEVITSLAKRGETQAAHDLTADLRDPSRKAPALAALIAGAAQKADAKQLETWMNELRGLKTDSPQLTDQVAVLGSIARAEKALYKDERWRNSFQLALNAAERADDSQRSGLVTSLAGYLAAIKTGRAVLD